MPQDEAWRREIVMDTYVDASPRSEGMKVLGWRDVPTDNSSLGVSVKPTEPVHLQVFIGAQPEGRDATTSSSASSTSSAR